MPDLYREEIMDIYKNPARRGKLSDASITTDKKNPMCGDDIYVQLKIEKGLIKDARFDGSACLVSIVSSEILLDFLVDKTIEEARKITKDELLDMLKLNLTTSRVGCATLALTAVQKAIEEYEEKK